MLFITHIAPQDDASADTQCRKETICLCHHLYRVLKVYPGGTQHSQFYRATNKHPVSRLLVIQNAHHSPNLKFRNFRGNSCLHASPATAVLSSAAYLWQDLKILPARKSLQPYTRAYNLKLCVQTCTVCTFLEKLFVVTE